MIKTTYRYLDTDLTQKYYRNLNVKLLKYPELELCKHCGTKGYYISYNNRIHYQIQCPQCKTIQSIV